MNLSFFIAKKYFLSSKKKTFINVISIISMLIVALCTASLVIVLSVFNGLGDLISSLYSTFDPQIKIEAAKGKSFIYDNDLKKTISAIEGVGIVTEVIEDYAYVRFRQSDMVVTMKGVSENFLDQERFGEHAWVSGELKLKKGDINYAIVGRGVQYMLSIVPGDDLNPLQIYHVKDVKSGSLDPSKLYSRNNIMVSSSFAIEKQYDENYIFVPLEFAEKLLKYNGRRTALEIKTTDGYEIAEVQQEVKNILGDSFLVLNNREQHADLYKLLNLEKFFVFLAFVMILAVGSINIFFALTMLAIDKRKDVSVLYSMGATDNLIKKIFIGEGAIISLGGAGIGLFLGALICWLQQTVGLVSMGMETSVMEYYPVKMKITDFLITALSLTFITIIISYRPAKMATKYNSIKYL
ncbi:MAG: FtsX-like permease family protein [Bacteroidota bacterium]